METTPCQAICEDYENPRYHASMQRIICPGSKSCSRKGTVQVKHLTLCKTHARMAKEGLIEKSGQTVGRNDARDWREKAYREYKKALERFRKNRHAVPWGVRPQLDTVPGPNKWALTFDEHYARQREIFGAEMKMAIARALSAVLERPVVISESIDGPCVLKAEGGIEIIGSLNDILREASKIS